MTLIVRTEKMPLRVDEGGTVRIGETRVSLEVVISSFLAGATAEEILQQFPTLQVADVYYVLGYYLRHRDEVDAYMGQQEHQAEQARARLEAGRDQSGISRGLLRKHACC